MSWQLLHYFKYLRFLKSTADGSHPSLTTTQTWPLTSRITVVVPGPVLILWQLQAKSVKVKGPVQHDWSNLSLNTAELLHAISPEWKLGICEAEKCFKSSTPGSGARACCPSMLRFIVSPNKQTRKEGLLQWELLSTLHMVKTGGDTSYLGPEFCNDTYT